MTFNQPDERYFLILYGKFRRNEYISAKRKTKREFIMSNARELNEVESCY